MLSMRWLWRVPPLNEKRLFEKILGWACSEVVQSDNSFVAFVCNPIAVIGNRLETLHGWSATQLIYVDPPPSNSDYKGQYGTYQVHF